MLERGFDTLDTAKEYLGLSGYTFSNPYDISNMHEAVVRINEAISQNQNIVVYSDYDTDGVCGCSIMLMLQRAGYENVSYYTLSVWVRATG